MRANFKTGIALVALAVLALGTPPARADDSRGSRSYRQQRGHSDVRIRLDFGRHNDRSRRYNDNYRHYDSYRYNDHRVREEHHYRNHYSRDDYHDAHHRGHH